MKKKLFTLVLTLLVVITCTLGLTACGGNEPTEGLEYTLSDDGTYYICSGIGTATEKDIVIPSTYNGKPVASIGERAFYSYRKLKSIVIPDSVTSIGERAFYGRSHLKSVTMGNGVTSIGEHAFYNCSNLKSITISDSLISIGDWAFRYCSSLTIYCEAEAKPDGWHSDWNSSNRPVEWGYKGN